MTAIGAAWQAGILAFNEQAMTPMEGLGWQDRDARLYRYGINQAYYNGNPYGTPFVTANVSRLGLYKFIRPIFIPQARLVELYVGEVYGGSIDMKELADGAIPIETENEALRQSIIQLYRNSNWQMDKSLFVRYGAMLGDVAVKVVDNRQMGQVRLEVIHPAKIHAVERDSVGYVTFARIEYERADINLDTGNSDSKYVYTEEITPDEFRTFKDGKPFAYFSDSTGQARDTWGNEYGFVPLEVVQHRDMGLGWGASCFHHARHKVDEINDAWSILNDNTRKAVNIVWFFKNRRSDITITPSERDNTPMIFGGENASDPFAMVPNIDIGAAGQNILNLLAEVERDMPELALHQLRDTGNMTAPGIRAGWSDAIDRIVEARGNYDGGLVKLNKMGCFIGSMFRYSGFEDGPYTDLDDERLEHHIPERAVIEDQLTQEQELQVLRNLPKESPELSRLIMGRLKVPEDTIETIVAEMMMAQQQKQLQAQQNPFGSNGNGAPNSPQLPGRTPPQLTAGPQMPDNRNGADDVSAEVQRILQQVGVAA